MESGQGVGGEPRCGDGRGDQNLPLFLLPVFIVRREWPLVTRVIGLSCLLWLLPVIYFGPRRTVALYRSWANPLVFHLSRLKTSILSISRYREQRPMAYSRRLCHAP